jgi:hypothetical protein
MSTIKIISKQFVNEFHSQPAPVLTGNIGDRITATFQVVYDGHVYGSPAAPIAYGIPNPSVPDANKYIHNCCFR